MKACGLIVYPTGWKLKPVNLMQDERERSSLFIRRPKGKLSLRIQKLCGGDLQSQSWANEAIYMKPMMERDI